MKGFQCNFLLPSADKTEHELQSQFIQKKSGHL